VTTLKDLHGALGGELKRDAATTLRRVTVDSRDAGPDALFVAVRGSRADGHDWLDQAVDGGCRAVVTRAEWTRDPGVGWLRLPESRETPARAARLVHGAPDAGLCAAGVTGTNGKTTTSLLLRSLLAELRGGCGLLGTIRYETGRATRPAPLTTPDGPALYAALAEMRDAGLGAVALEVSSHALDQGRVAGLELDVGVLTNLSRDHLDYHGTLEAYLAAKLRLLELLRGPGRTKPPGALALNADDPAFAGLRPDGLKTVRWSTGWRGAPAGRVDVRVTGAELRPDGTRLDLDVRGRAVSLRSQLVGRFNVENLTAALAAGVALGEDAAHVADALAAASQVPGRMEGFALPAGATAVVDYAHTPDALAAVLASCRELCDAALHVVFGCGGDRDRGKRPLMGAVAARDADVTWITSDNPRSEEPASICEAIREGYREAGGRGDRCRLDVDRAAAIRAALAAAGEGDLVVIAGKGHEDYQIVGDRRLHLDDREIVRDWIAAAEGARG